MALAPEIFPDRASQTASRRRTVVVGVLGCGTVGGGIVARLLADGHVVGTPIQLGRVLVRDLGKPRFPETVRPYLTTRHDEVVDDPAVDIVIETIGGTDVARELVERALRHGKHVVSANKALIAVAGAKLMSLAREHRAGFRYEAAVGGAVPIVRAVSDVLVAEDVRAIAGVMNGTSNYIMGRMADGNDFSVALHEAQTAGYAEPDPTNDVEGFDAAQKVAVLAGLAFGRALAVDRMTRRSLRDLSADDFSLAKRLGLALAPLACVQRSGDELESYIGPAYLASDHDFARAKGPGNVIRVDGAHSGPLQFSGTGAGRSATASAVMSDLADIIGRLSRWERQRAEEVEHLPAIPVAPQHPLLVRTESGAAERVAAALGAYGARVAADDAVITEPVAVDRVGFVLRAGSGAALSAFPLIDAAVVL
ncbi:MAG: homoserine dehydrogenase [Vulcanimicrobiaceae bacterium]